MQPGKFILFFLLCLCLCACGGNDASKKAEDAAPVRVEQVIKSNMTRTLHAVGNVQSSASVAIIPRVAGEILEINFREGQDVVAGQPLIRIDPRPYEAVLKEKRGLLAKSQAQLAKALDDRRRFGKLVGNGYVSRESYEQAATDAAALRATVESDKAAVESAALDLAYCTLFAPIGGRIGALNLDKGNMVKSNDANPIVSIDAIQPCYVVFSVPEANLPAILSRLDKEPVELTATPTGGSAETGQLTLVDNSVDVKTGTIRLRGVFQNEKRRLWPGQFVEVLLPLGESQDTLIIPTRAIQSGRDGSYIYLVDDAGRARYENVRVLFENGSQSAVQGNIRPGQKVVVEGHVRLAPGMAVKILD